MVGPVDFNKMVGPVKWHIAKDQQQRYPGGVPDADPEEDKVPGAAGEEDYPEAEEEEVDWHRRSWPEEELAGGGASRRRRWCGGGSGRRRGGILRRRKCGEVLPEELAGVAGRREEAWRSERRRRWSGGVS